MPRVRGALFLLAALGGLVTAQAADYALILKDPPVAKKSGFQKGLLTEGLKVEREQIRARQESLRTELTARHIAVRGSVQVLLNAVFVRTSRSREAELRSLPGVARIVFLPRSRVKLNVAAGLIDAPSAWANLGGVANAGKGTKIAEIDTGIFPSHPAFQNNSLPPVNGYPLCDPGQCGFNTPKIIVARSYIQEEAAGSDPSNPALDSRPDDYSLLDHAGHGTGTASIAAGETNTGPAATITGIAPQAYLGIYKVIGTPGVQDGASTQVLIEALEQATTDGMDFVNYSIGGPSFTPSNATGDACGAPAGEFCDPLAEAVEMATQSGVLVVCANGNEGSYGIQYPNAPTMNSIDSPAHAPSALAVAAATNAHSYYNQLHVHGTNLPANLQNASIQFGNGPMPIGQLTAVVVNTSSLGSSLACGAFSAGSLNGDIALIERGTCNFATKIINAENAGAVGVIVYDNASSTTLTSMDDGSTDIPAAFLGGTDGATLVAYLQSNPGIAVSLDPYGYTLFAVSGAGQIDLFSSRGPALSGALKPDLTAIGENVYLAAESFDPNGDSYSPTGYTIQAGTSASTPMATGAAALVKQHNPALSPLQIKSALMNTAAQTLIDPFTGGSASVTAGGAGLLDVNAAVQANVSIVPSSVSFGFLEATSVLPAKVALQLTNTGSTPVTLTILVTPSVSAANATVTVDQSSISLAAGKSATLNVSLTGAVPTPGIYEGNITIQGAAVPLHVPYLFVRGDGVPFNLYALLGDGSTGTAGQEVPDGELAVMVTDQYGFPVGGLPVQFGVTAGNGSIQSPDPTTNQYGIATAGAVLGTTPGNNQFAALVQGGLEVPFNATGRPVPTINPSGATNAASFQATAAAPGSYISLFGTGLSDFTDATTTTTLMPAIDLVSVSFDVPSAGISVPGRLYYVSPTQVNVQVPWELSGQSSALIKVNIDLTTGALYTLPVATYAPAFFSYVEPGTNRTLLAAEDANFQVITSTHAAVRGQTVLLYGNGLGPVTNQPVDGAPAPSKQPLSETTNLPTVTIGGKAATVSFSGLAPGFPGLYQLNVIVPADAPTGLQPVIVKIGNVASPTANLPIS